MIAEQLGWTDVMPTVYGPYVGELIGQNPEGKTTYVPLFNEALSGRT